MTTRKTSWLLGLGIAFSGLYLMLQGSDGSSGQNTEITSSSERKPETLSPPERAAFERVVAETPTDEEPFLASSSPPLSDPLHDAEVEPHPITEERIKMAEHHELFLRITESLKEKNLYEARSLIQQHYAQFGSEEKSDEGWEADRRGFERILDCLETRSEALEVRETARQQAEQFIEKERISPLRRHVRRVCLGERDF